MAKTACPISRIYFKTEAKVLTVEIKDHDGKVLFSRSVMPREFATGSMGWSLSDKAELGVGPSDKPRAQVGLNITLIGSKELPKG